MTIRTARTPIRWAALLLPIVIIATATLGQERPRLRDLGLSPGVLPTGKLNAITDVPGVAVGHQTIIKGKNVRTGVTAILPHDGNLFQEKVPAAVYVANGFGKAAGFLQVQELGLIETPIILTNTLSVGTALEATVAWTLRQTGNEDIRSVNAVVGETNDGYLNDIRGMHVKPKDVIKAIETATNGPVAEGSIGAGTGTRALGYKGGIGTSSRKLPDNRGGYTIGALVQTNFGGQLTIMGHVIGRPPRFGQADTDPVEYGSIMIVIATDAPLSDRNLKRVAKRAVIGLGRTGSTMSNGSGDFIIAFSTANKVPYDSEERTHAGSYLRNNAMSSIFLATVEAVEEAIYNSLLAATTVTGYNGNTSEAIPLELVRGLVEK